MEILSKYGDEAVTGPTGSFACMGPVVVLLFGLLFAAHVGAGAVGLVVTKYTHTPGICLPVCYGR